MMVTDTRLGAGTRNLVEHPRKIIVIMFSREFWLREICGLWCYWLSELFAPFSFLGWLRSSSIRWRSLLVSWCFSHFISPMRSSVSWDEHSCNGDISLIFSSKWLVYQFCVSTKRFSFPGVTNHSVTLSSCSSRLSRCLLSCIVSPPNFCRPMITTPAGSLL